MRDGEQQLFATFHQVLGTLVGFLQLHTVTVHAAHVAPHPYEQSECGQGGKQRENAHLPRSLPAVFSFGAGFVLQHALLFAVNVVHQSHDAFRQGSTAQPELSRLFLQIPAVCRIAACEVAVNALQNVGHRVADVHVGLCAVVRGFIFQVVYTECIVLWLSESIAQSVPKAFFVAVNHHLLAIFVNRHFYLRTHIDGFSTGAQVGNFLFQVASLVSFAPHGSHKFHYAFAFQHQEFA